MAVQRPPGSATTPGPAGGGKRWTTATRSHQSVGARGEKRVCADSGDVRMMGENSSTYYVRRKQTLVLAAGQRVIRAGLAMEHQ